MSIEKSRSQDLGPKEIIRRIMGRQKVDIQQATSALLVHLAGNWTISVSASQRSSCHGAGGWWLVAATKKRGGSQYPSCAGSRLPTTFSPLFTQQRAPQESESGLKMKIVVVKSVPPSCPEEYDPLRVIDIPKNNTKIGNKNNCLFLKIFPIN